MHQCSAASTERGGQSFSAQRGLWVVETQADEAAVAAAVSVVVDECVCECQV